MTATGDAQLLDRDELRRLFDLRSSYNAHSGGGYTVLQQLVIDTTGKPFASFMEQVVLKPMGMLDSTFEQPPPKNLASRTAAGYYASGKAVEGRWHIYPEMAAAGLWTTPSDLAHFAIGIEESAAGKHNPVISSELTRKMLTRQIESDGLGVFLDGSGNELRFMHSGRDEGFDAEMVAYVETGQGAVVMMNANDNSGAIRRVSSAP